MDRPYLLRLILLLIAVLLAQMELAASRQNPSDRARGSSTEAVNLLAHRFAYANPMLLTFQGAVLGANLELEPVVLHAWVKAKVLKTGSYIIRAVLNTQRTALQSMADKLNALFLLAYACAFTVMCRRRRFCTLT